MSTSEHPIAFTRRCIFAPDDNGPLLILMGFGRDGKEVFGVRCHPAQPSYRWAADGSPGADLKRLRRLYDKTNKE